MDMDLEMSILISRLFQFHSGMVKETNTFSKMLCLILLQGILGFLV